MKKKATEKKVLSTNAFPVVGIGASAGGLDAFKKLLKAIPEDSGMAYVLVQHLDPSHESLLPDLLQKVTNIPVLEISDEIKVEPNHIYVIPSNKMMVANDGVLQLTSRLAKTKNERHLPIDLFFTSLAEVHQTHAIGVVLSGTASDGTLGLKAIKDHGGITFAQDEASAAYEGMPNSAVQAGVVDFILSPDKMPQKILELSKSMNGNGGDGQTLLQEDEDVFKQIISLLRIGKGTDFTYYKQTTIRRRILRRMALNKNEKPTAYLNYIRENKTEQDALYQDLLIPVTTFFRDQKIFDHLSETVFPHLLKNKIAGVPIRIWVAGCSTGEEAYSIAICFKEFLGDRQEEVQIQIFATDISEPALAKARLGIYTKDDVAGVTPRQLKEFFTKTNGDFQINKSMRDMLVFALHNFLKNPPFGKMLFISCRNVLIYMEQYLQKKALTTFHYALNPKGLLLLGKSETVSSVPDLFASADKQDKLFLRKDVPSKFMNSASPRIEQNFAELNAHSKNETLRTDFQKTADDIMLGKYTPAGVVVNEAMDIVHFRGNTSNYLEQAAGKPSHHLLKMAKQGLAFELRTILYKAKKIKDAAIKENIPFQISGTLHYISIEAIPLPNIVEPHYLLLFHDTVHISKSKTKTKTPASAKSKKDSKDLRIQQLEKELAQTHENMRSITEDQEVANEELQSANEELLSSSEEAQSLNEELETSKEELQSTNEELIIINQELLSLNERVSETRDYAEAIIATIHEPMVILDKNLRVKSANKSFYDNFQVKKEQTEGELLYDLGNKQWNIPSLRELLEDIIQKNSHFHDFEVTHKFHDIGEKIMLLNAKLIVQKSHGAQLILLAIHDVTEVRTKTLKLQLAEKELLNKDISKRKEEKVRLEEAVGERTKELEQVNKVLSLQNHEKEKRAAELIIANKELAFQNEEKEKRAAELILANKELAFQNEEKEKRATELILASKELAFQNEEKEKRAAELILANKELAFQNEEKEKRAAELIVINKELESFSYVASHDLQEPLRKIQTFARIILEKENETLSETGKDYFQRMQKAAKRMQVLITDLLTYSDINTGAQKFEATDLTRIVEEVSSDFKEMIDEKNATIEINHLGSAHVIAFQFHQLIQNLISNALKFSKLDISPHITINSRASKGEIFNTENPDVGGRLSSETNYLHISFSDNGIGFEPRFKDQIFDVFQRLHGKEEYAGTGIGLAIVKKIVENHKGIITATSELGKGAAFNIYLPETRI